MHVILDSFAVWLRSTSLSEAIRVLPWLWPVCEIVHFTGLSLLVGVVGFFDLRLLGLFARVPLNAAWSLMPWGKAGFGLAAITGLTFFIGAPDQIRHERSVLRQAGLSGDRGPQCHVVRKDLRRGCGGERCPRRDAAGVQGHRGHVDRLLVSRDLLGAHAAVCR